MPGWDFIAKFASRGKEEESSKSEGFKSQQIPPITKFMKDIIAGRPVFGGPLQPGGFRLRYGRSRPSGLAAASTNTASMLALDDFITIGTQMKIERPGKACAITPCDEAEGPWVVLEDGRFLRIDDASAFVKLRQSVKQVWDNGELVVGYGEFLENNKRLVPAGYTMDWWASDVLAELVSHQDVSDFLAILRRKSGGLARRCAGRASRGDGRPRRAVLGSPRLASTPAATVANMGSGCWLFTPIWRVASSTAQPVVQGLPTGVASCVSGPVGNRHHRAGVRTHRSPGRSSTTAGRTLASAIGRGAQLGRLDHGRT